MKKLKKNVIFDEKAFFMPTNIIYRNIQKF